MKNTGSAWIVPVAAVALLTAAGGLGYSYLSCGSCSGGSCPISALFGSSSTPAPAVTPAAAMTEDACCPGEGVAKDDCGEACEDACAEACESGEIVVEGEAIEVTPASAPADGN